MRRQLLSLSLLGGALVSACAALPTPTAPPGGAARLDPASVSYDRIAFQTDRRLPFGSDEACAQLGPGTGTFSADYGCRNDTTTLELPERSFAVFWDGAMPEAYSGFSHSRRQVLLGRYYAVELVDQNFLGRPCTVAVDLGSATVLTVQAGPTSAETDVLPDGADLPAEDGLTHCDQARTVAEKLLTTLDPAGGSVTGTP